MSDEMLTNVGVDEPQFDSHVLTTVTTLEIVSDSTAAEGVECEEHLTVDIIDGHEKDQELVNGEQEIDGEQEIVGEIDTNEMEQVFQSEVFREELHEMIAEQLSNNFLNSHRPLTDILSLRQRFCRTEGISQQEWAVIPVADIRGVETSNYAKNEKLLRSRLASCYRLIDLFGWSDGFTSGSITARVEEETEVGYLLVAPYSLICDEVTASSLVKVAVNGSELIDAGSTQLGIELQSLALHTSLYSACNRTDIKCIIHLTCVNALTLSIMKCGLLPLCPEAMTLGEISYADYDGSIDDLGDALGPTNKILVLRNNGIVICGGSIEEAFHLAFNTMSAVDVQMTIAAFGLDKVHLPSDEMCRNVYDNDRRPPVGATGTKRRWRRGELEFEAMMRQLDSIGCQTGYIYQDVQPGLAKRNRSNSDADLTPFASHIGSFGGSDRELSRLGGSPLKVPKRSVTPSDWRASPNIYHREQILEKTTDRQEKKITKWIPTDNAPTSRPGSAMGTSSRLEKPNQFAPQGINPAELKEKVKAIRRDYFTDRVTAGPQSRILEGINWNEAQMMKEGAPCGTATADSSVTSVKAVSKGVIQREHQHTATVLCQNLFDPPNPFNRMSEDDIELYKSSVEHRGKTDESDAQYVTVEDGN